MKFGRRNLRTVGQLACVVLVMSACTPSEAAPDTTGLEVESPSTTISGTTTTTTSGTTTTTAAVSDAPEVTPVPTIPESEIEPTEIPGQVVINGSPQQSVAVLGSGLDRLDLVDNPGEFISQATWSPDGQFVAWSRVEASGAASIVVASVVDGTQREYATPFQVFYIQWRPDSQAIGVLGAGGFGTALAIVDLEADLVTEMHSAGSFYFEWSPDGQTLITHLDSSRLELVDVESGAITPIDTETGSFQSATWTHDGEAVIYVRPLTIQSAAAGGFFIQAPSEQLVMHDLASNRITVLAEADGISNFALSPDGSRLAYSASGNGSDTLMQVVDLATGTAETIQAGIVFVWQWSPDGDKILVVGLGPEEFAFRVWDSGSITTYFGALSTEAFFSRHLVYWGQYDRSMTLWAPDSSAFVFAAQDRGGDFIFLQSLDEDSPARIAEGSVAAFSPAGR